MNKLINITPAAINFLKSSIENEKCRGVRLDIKLGGCRGLTYGLEYVNETAAGDVLVKEDGVYVYVSSKAALFVGDMTIDYVTSPMGGNIVFENPNAKTICSCGKSFSVENGGVCNGVCHG
jgi:iron-sulfur cluster assembly accessory protein